MKVVDKYVVEEIILMVSDGSYGILFLSIFNS
jgi:hypothetical protein